MAARDESEPAASPPLAEQAYRLLRKRIVDGVLPPGHRLSARRIVAGSGLGATPVREALARLTHEGLVQTLPRRGYIVSPITEKTLADFFSVWQLIGPMIVEQGVIRRDERTLAKLDTCMQRTIALAEAPTPADAATSIRLSEERFTLLAHATENPHLIAINSRLSADLERIYSLHVRDFGLSNDHLVNAGQIARHRAFLGFLRSRDGAAAAAMTAMAIRKSCADLLDALRRQPRHIASPPGQR